MNTFEIKKGYFTIWDGKTKYDYHVDGNHDYSRIIEPEIIYQLAIEKNLTESETIDLILKWVHKKRIIKVGYLTNTSICVTLIGHRGGGKTVGATQILVVDGLLPGRKVVSNLPIALKVRYKDAEKVFETEDLDAVTMLDFNDFENNYQDCWIFIDETNVDIADAQRTMTNQSLFFSHILQQMRHRKLDFMFTTQSEMFLPNRARFQTDIMIKCSDIAMSSSYNPKQSEIGRKSKWDIYDYSGIFPKAKIRDLDKRLYELTPYKHLKVWNTPFWNCYSTELMQRWEKVKLKTYGKKRIESNGIIDKFADKFMVPSELIIKSIQMSGERISRSDLWDKFEVYDKSLQSRLGKVYAEIKVETVAGKKRDYKFPMQAEMLQNITLSILESELEGMNV